LLLTSVSVKPHPPCHELPEGFEDVTERHAGVTIAVVG